VDLATLETGELWRFSSLNEAVPHNIVGVYTIWQNATLIYVGIGGLRVRYREPGDESEPVTAVKGLRGRLEQHKSGDRSGDKFCIYVCDRFVLPSLSGYEIEQVARGELSLDVRTREWINSHYAFRYLETVGGSQARQIEREVQRGVLTAGPPMLNPRS
jgi:hypothetical protein